MGEDKDSEKEGPKIPMWKSFEDMPMLRFKKFFEDIYTEDMKEEVNEIKKDTTKTLYRTLAVLLIVPFLWLVFLSVYCFLWSTSFTFYQNLVITFDSIVIALMLTVGLAYAVSVGGLRKVYKKARGLTSKLNEKIKKKAV